MTKLSRDEYADPHSAMKVFEPFLEKHYKGKYRYQGRSIGIELSYVDLDLVVTAAPSEEEEGCLTANAVVTEDSPEESDDWRLVPSWVAVENRSAATFNLLKEAKAQAEWQLSPLWIPNREAKVWEETHPLAQIQWTFGKNARTNRHYVNVVKAWKWWRRVHHPDGQPKGYPVEHLIGAGCPDGIKSVAAGVVQTLESFVNSYRAMAILKQTPFLGDHGVPAHNVWGRITGEEFATFHAQAAAAAATARAAYDAEDLKQSVLLWRKLFGNEFPPAPDDGGGSSKGGGFSPRQEPSVVGGGRFA